MRTVLSRLCAYAIPVFAAALLWTQAAPKPPLAKPPIETPVSNYSTIATRWATATPGIPTSTPTLRPTPTVQLLRQADGSPTSEAGPSAELRDPTPSPAMAGQDASTSLPPLPAVVRLRADHTGRYLLIDQVTQTMHVFEGWRKIRELPISTGIPDPQTLTPEWSGFVGRYVGSFRSFGTEQDDGWYLFSSGGDILLHGAPYRLDGGGSKSYVDLEALGRRPSSHGCIRMDPQDAAWITAWNPEGVPVTITAWPSGQPGRDSHFETEGVG
jgi:lipoprotein-anchoring transpeptidase ErfK/SrfK